jgi:hypothetical protein
MISYLVITLVALAVSALTLFSGFGLGTILMPAFAIFFPLPVAVAATAVVHLQSCMVRPLVLITILPASKKLSVTATVQFMMLKAN